MGPTHLSAQKAASALHLTLALKKLRFFQ
jgi:hypothetical protein